MNNIELIKSMYKAFADRDHQTLTQICHPQIEWIQNKGFPNGGHNIGIEAIIENVFNSFAKLWLDFKFEKLEFLDSGKAVTVIGFYQGTNKETEKSFHSDTVHVFEIENNQVKRFRQFADTKMMWDAIV